MTITGSCKRDPGSRWLQLLLCAFLLLQATLVAAEPGECSGRFVFAVGHDTAFEQEPSPAALESEAAEGLEDSFSSLTGVSPEISDPLRRVLIRRLPDTISTSHLRKGHLSRAPPLV